MLRPDTAVLIDVANVAHYSGEPLDDVFWHPPQPASKPSFDRIMLVVDEAKRLGFAPLLIADTSLQYRIDKPGSYRAMLQKGLVEETPKADDLILGGLRAQRSDLPQAIAVDVAREVRAADEALSRVRSALQRAPVLCRQPY